MAKDLSWLREHMRNRIANAAANDAPENVFNFQQDPRSSATTQATSALDLVQQAAELIRDIEDRVTETEVYARNLSASALEKLQLSESRAQSAEIARRAAEADMNNAMARVQELEDSLAQAESRTSTAEAQLSAAEQRADAAETRASETERALVRVEDAIRSQLLGVARKASRNLIRAA